MIEGNSSFDRRQFGHASASEILDSVSRISKNTFGSGDIGDDLVVEVAQVHDRIPKTSKYRSRMRSDTEGNLIRDREGQCR